MSADGFVEIYRDPADSRFPSFPQGFDRRWCADRCETVYLASTPADMAKALDAAVARFGRDVRNLVAVERRWDPNDYSNSAQSIPVE